MKARLGTWSLLLGLALALAPPPTAVAGAVQSRQVGDKALGSGDPWRDYPAREVERPILVPAKGIEATLNLRSLSTDRRLDQDGRAIDTAGKYNRLDVAIGIAYGLTDRVELGAGATYITGEIGDAKGGGLGDILASVAVGLLPPGGRADLALGLGASYPLGGSNYDFELQGHNAVLQSFPTHLPSYALFPAVEGRYRMGPVSLRLGLSGAISHEGQVNLGTFGADTKQVMMDPGDGYDVTAGAYWQVTDHWVPGLSLDYTNLSETRIDGKGMHDAEQRYELQPSIMFQQSRAFEAKLGVGIVLAGQNTTLGYPIILQINSRF